MCYYVYILRSLVNGDMYIGSTAHIAQRIESHNHGRVKSTKGYRPWQLLEYKEFSTRREAVQKERYLKTHQHKEMLKKKYGPVVK